MARKYLGKAKGCHFRITLEDFPKASFSDQRKPADLAAEFPHLRPCKLHDWKWIYRSSCDYCKYAIFEDGTTNGREEADNQPDQSDQGKMPGLQRDVERGKTVPRPPMPTVGIPIRQKPLPQRPCAFRRPEKSGG